MELTSEMLLAPRSPTHPAEVRRRQVADLADCEPCPAGRPRPPQPYGWVLDTARPLIPFLGVDHPAAPVDVRWSAAVDRVRRANDPGTARTDPWVGRATRYLQALLTCQTEADRKQVGREHPDVDAALRLHAGDDKLARGIVEARLLAGQSVDEVAAACSFTPGAVAAYEALFFAVIGKLHADMYILINAAGEKMWHGLTEGDVDVILKWLGYLKGPILLDAAVRYCKSGWSIPGTLDGLTRPQLEELHLMLLLRTLVLVWVLPFERFGRVFRLQELLGELKAVIDSWSAEPRVWCSSANDDPRHTATRRLAPDAAGRVSGTAEATVPLDLAAATWWSAWRKAVLAA